MKSLIIVGLLLAGVMAVANGMCAFEHVQTKFCNADYVIRAKITSAVRFDIPALPDTPSPPVQKPGTRGNGHGQNKTKKQLLKDIGPVPIRGMAPAPRLRRSIAAPSGMGRFNPMMIQKFQEIKIKRILKGFGAVEKTDGTTPEDKNNTKYTRYFSRVYLSSPPGFLKIGKSYLLAGKIINNKLRISFCDWHDEWESLTLDQLRSLKKDFVHGCKCRVVVCYYRGCENSNKARDVCMWKPDSYIPGKDCRAKHSACRAVNGQCQWRKNKNLVKCEKDKESKMP